MTTIFTIDAYSIPAPPFESAIDHDAIMVSQVENCCFIGSTIITPTTGSQPFSGKRQLGYTTNSLGHMIIYTEAIDVAHLTGLAKLGELVTGMAGPSACSVETYYDIAEATWDNFQKDVRLHINGLGGTAHIGAKKLKKISVETVYNLLHREDKILNVPCD